MKTNYQIFISCSAWISVCLIKSKSVKPYFVRSKHLLGECDGLESGSAGQGCPVLPCGGVGIMLWYGLECAWRFTLHPPPSWPQSQYIIIQRGEPGFLGGIQLIQMAATFQLFIANNRYFDSSSPGRQDRCKMGIKSYSVKTNKNQRQLVFF